MKLQNTAPMIDMNTKTYWCKSQSLYTKDNINYFPNGIPLSSDCSLVEKYPYNDEKDEMFYICYTKTQILEEVKKYGYFSPYIPLCCVISCCK